MIVTFINDDFLLHSEPARTLFHEHAAKMPVYDFHSHLSPAALAANTGFRSITHAWLDADHYKWRAMRAYGIPEPMVTGKASDREKFGAWARTVPFCIGNPLHHWTHLELARVFGFRDTLLSPDTAEAVYAHCNALLATDAYRPRALLERMNVRLVCTTDDPADSLDDHAKVRADGSFDARIVPAFRPDRARMIDKPDIFNTWIGKLERSAGVRINSVDALLDALASRHNTFHAAGCRISDHGMEVPPTGPCTHREAARIFRNAVAGRDVNPDEASAFGFFVLRECAMMDARAGWVMQLHIGAMRNNNTLLFRSLGTDIGCDAISDRPIARPLAFFLDALARENALPKTVVYPLDPSKLETIAALAGCFQGASVQNAGEEALVRGSFQLGPAWWFSDTKDGIRRQLGVLMEYGVLGDFIGMTTDSRSMLSFPRHEYFRRILCDTLGRGIIRGEIPGDIEFVGRMVEDICYHNARNFFGIEV